MENGIFKPGSRKICLTIALWMQLSAVRGEEYADFSLEMLSDVPVVMSAKKEARLFEASTGLFVFDEDAIAHLPVDSIPEMLRYAPGAHITRTSNGSWGVGIRGMNSLLSNRVQFNVDEQSVYSGQFAGLFGAQHDMPLEDVASVEVVYGPGGGMWGGNAANGRVNVVMKSAFETEGGLLKTQYGTENRLLSGRYGWSVNKETAARIYVQAGDRESSSSSLFRDDWERLQAGFQVDTRPSAKDLFSVSGEVYETDLGSARKLMDLSTGSTAVVQRNDLHMGHNGQVKWTRQIDANNGFTARAWTGHSNYSALEFWNSGLDFRSKTRFGENHSFVFTVGGSNDKVNLVDDDWLKFREDADRASWEAHGGGEYTVTSADGKLDFSLGLHGTGGSWQEEVYWLPSARAIFRASEKDRVWLSYSESAHAYPLLLRGNHKTQYNTRIIDPVDVPTPFGLVRIDQQVTTLRTLDEKDYEESQALQVGYRRQLGERGSLMVNGFYYVYTGIFGGIDLGVVPYLFVEHPFADVVTGVTNIADGESYGFEVSYDVPINRLLSGTFNYAFIGDNFELTVLPAGVPVETSPSLYHELLKLNNNVPNHMVSMWLHAQLSEALRVDIGVRCTSGYNNITYDQPSIFQSDARLSWEIDEAVEVSIVGRNLFQSATSENSLPENLDLATEQEREAYAEIRWKF